MESRGAPRVKGQEEGGSQRWSSSGTGGKSSVVPRKAVGHLEHRDLIGHWGAKTVKVCLARRGQEGHETESQRGRSAGLPFRMLWEAGQRSAEG